MPRPLVAVSSGLTAKAAGDTPGPIPNPEVKPAHVPCGTAVREPAGSLPSFEEGLGRRPRYASRPSLGGVWGRAPGRPAPPSLGGASTRAAQPPPGQGTAVRAARFVVHHKDGRLA